MRKRILFVPLIIAALVAAKSYESASPDDTKGNYDLSAPLERHVLPPVLNEISGITDISYSEIGCVQDEKGIIFIYDLKQRKLAQQVVFSVDGDYEGLTRVNNDMYVLRSDGMLTEVKNYRSKSMVKNSYHLDIPTINNEGLCYDEKNNRLLIAAKSKAGKGKELKDTRLIYAFDLVQKKLLSKPVLEIDVAALVRYAAAKKIKLPEAPKKKGEGTRSLFKFFPSSVAVHPFTGSIYVISAIDRTMAVFSPKGDIIDFYLLDKQKFNKPEGITFLANGDFVISNEGEGTVPTILKFAYKK